MKHMTALTISLGVLVSLSLMGLASAEVTVTGTIHSGVEAGCWLIQDDTGNHEYLLLDPPHDLQVNGLHAQVTGNIRTDLASYCMQGQGALEITSYSTLYTGVVMPGGFDGCQLLIGDDGQTYGLDGLPAPDGTNGPIGTWTNWHVTMYGSPTTPRAPCAAKWIHVIFVEGWDMTGTTVTNTVAQPTSTTTATCTTTWTHAGGYLPVPSGVCQEIEPSNPIVKTLTDIWNWLRSLLCPLPGFGFLCPV